MPEKTLHTSCSPTPRVKKNSERETLPCNSFYMYVSRQYTGPLSRATFSFAFARQMLLRHRLVFCMQRGAGRSCAVNGRGKMASIPPFSGLELVTLFEVFQMPRI